MKTTDIVTTAASQLEARLDPEHVPVEAVYGAAFCFIDRAWVFLDRSEGGTLLRLVPKRPLAAGELAQLSADLAQELEDHTLRARVRRDNAELLAAIHGDTFGAGGGSPPESSGDDAFGDLDDLSDLDFLDDPLGIATPWEESAGSAGPAAESGPGKGEDSGGDDPT